MLKQTVTLLSLVLLVVTGCGIVAADIEEPTVLESPPPASVSQATASPLSATLPLARATATSVGILPDEDSAQRLEYRVGALEAGLQAVSKRTEVLETLHEVPITTLSLRGALIAEAIGSAIHRLSFGLSVAEGIEIDDLIATYNDDHQTVILERNATARPGWGISSAEIVSQPGYYDISIDLSRLNPSLGRSTIFTLEIGVPGERPLVVTRTTPGELNSVNTLQ